jgi:hypothetical protein
MQSKLEPWTEIDKEDTLELDVVTGHQGIPRIRRDEIDGLGRLEQQADIVVCLSSRTFIIRRRVERKC